MICSFQVWFESWTSGGRTRTGDRENAGLL